MAAAAGGDHVFPAIGAAPGSGQHVIPGQLGAGKLLAAVEAAVIVAAEQGAVAQRRAEILDDPALDRHDGLQLDPRAQSGQALDAAVIGRQGLADSVDHVALGVGGDRFVYGDPATRLARHVQPQDGMHQTARSLTHRRG